MPKHYYCNQGLDIDLLSDYLRTCSRTLVSDKEYSNFCNSFSIEAFMEY